MVRFGRASISELGRCQCKVKPVRHGSKRHNSHDTGCFSLPEGQRRAVLALIGGEQARTTWNAV